MPQKKTHVRQRQKNGLKEARRYKVIIHNDGFTTMEVVVEVLKTVFVFSDEKAETLMLQVHRANKSRVGIYTCDIAVSKANKATNMAREQGFPLRLTVEPEEE